MLLTSLLALDAQSDMLSFVGQEAIAHAAGIFATLTAAFAFATGFKKFAKAEHHEQRRIVYTMSLSFLLALTAYLAIRMYSYGSFSATVATLPAQNTSLTAYWKNVTNATEAGNPVVHYGITGIYSSIALSWLFGYEFAQCITYYLIEGSEQPFWETLGRPVVLPVSWKGLHRTFALVFFILNTGLTYTSLRPIIIARSGSFYKFVLPHLTFHNFVLPYTTMIAMVVSAVVAAVLWLLSYSTFREHVEPKVN